MKRLVCCVTLMVLLAAIYLSGPVHAATNELQWFDARNLTLEGKAWPDTKHFYDRLPARAEKIVRPAVWSLSHDSAGMCVRFVSDATAIAARWTLRKESLAMNHMPASGVSGVDLYVRDLVQGSKSKAQGSRLNSPKTLNLEPRTLNSGWHWLGTGRPDKVTNEKSLAKDMSAQSREYLLYLPLYNGIESLEIGIPQAAHLVAAPSRLEKMKPIVFYGTSILQGGCASRPGMAYPSILGRHLDWPSINLGFSGNAWSEPEVAQLLAELDPSIYVLDSLPNLQPQQVEPRVEPFVKTLRATHPKTPIILVEHVIYPDGRYVKPRRERYENANAALRRVFERLKRAGDKNLYYVPATELIGTDGEGTVDGTHPTDLGFVRMAATMEQLLRAKLPRR